MIKMVINQGIIRLQQDFHLLPRHGTTRHMLSPSGTVSSPGPGAPLVLLKDIVLKDLLRQKPPKEWIKNDQTMATFNG